MSNAAQRRLKAITDARNAIAHPTGPNLSPLDATAVMAEARKILRQFDPAAASRVEEIDVLRRESRLSVDLPPVATSPSNDPFWSLWVDLGPEEFCVRLVKFMHDLTDMWDELDEGEEDVWKFHWGRGPEEVALALQKWFLFPQPFSGIVEPPEMSEGDDQGDTSP